MEEISQDVLEQEQAPFMRPIEIYDIFLNDGTHLRFCSATTDQQLMDVQSP